MSCGLALGEYGGCQRSWRICLHRLLTGRQCLQPFIDDFEDGFSKGQQPYLPAVLFLMVGSFCVAFRLVIQREWHDRDFVANGGCCSLFRLLADISDQICPIYQSNASGRAFFAKDK